jgi:hypothetical protein
LRTCHSLKLNPFSNTNTNKKPHSQCSKWTERHQSTRRETCLNTHTPIHKPSTPLPGSSLACCAHGTTCQIRPCLSAPARLSVALSFFFLCFSPSSGPRLFFTPPPFPLAPTLSRSLSQVGMAACRWLTPSLFSRCTVLVAIFPHLASSSVPSPSCGFLTVLTVPPPLFLCCCLLPCMRLNLVLPPFDGHRFLSALVPP